MHARSILASTVLVGLGFAAPAIAAPANRISKEIRIGACIHASARGHIWLERTLWALRDTEGGWIGATRLNRDGSYDLGPMQVNSWWIPELARMLDRQEKQIARWLHDDPCFNVEVARWIFLSSLAQAKDYWTAVGLYHSRNVHLQASYAHRVWTRYKRRLDAERGSGYGRVKRSDLIAWACVDGCLPKLSVPRHRALQNPAP